MQQNYLQVRDIVRIKRERAEAIVKLQKEILLKIEEEVERVLSSIQRCECLDLQFDAGHFLVRKKWIDECTSKLELLELRRADAYRSLDRAVDDVKACLVAEEVVSSQHK